MEKLRLLLKNDRFRVVALTVFAVAALVFLAAGLSQLELRPGEALPQILEESQPRGSFVGLPGGDWILFILRVAYFVGLVLMPFFIIYLILNPEARKRFFRDLLRVGAFVLILYFASNFLRSLSKEGQKEGLGGVPQAPPQLPGGEALRFTPQTPPWLVLAVSALLALLLTALVGLALWLFFRRKASEPPLKRIAEEAQVALEAIRAGGDLKNIILRCYAEMSRVLHEQRNIQRPQYMTPHEFEAALEGRGLPPEPVRTLTRLFEEVRYGTKLPGEWEERQALDSLAAIVTASGGASGGGP